MVSRRAALAFSVTIALLAYALLFWFAPRISLLRADAMAEPARRLFKVELRDDIPPEPVRAREGAPELASRPGSVRDMLVRAEDVISTPAPTLTPAADDPGRTGDLPLDREYDLAPAPEFQKRLDARIIEITRESARPEIDIARRLVRPSPDRILSDADMPAIRSALAERESESLRFRGGPASVLAETLAGGGDAPLPPRLSTELPPTLPVLGGPPPAVAKAEERVAAAPAERLVDRVRSESRFEFWDDLVEIDLDVYAEPGDSSGFFRLRLRPRTGADLVPLPKDVTFVIDASNSIGSRKLTLTERGVQAALASLRPEDLFNVVAFRDTSIPFRPTPVPATPENMREAEKYLQSLAARGETDVYKALLPVVSQSPRPGSPGIVLVATDGRPTMGIRDGRTIINGVTSDNALRQSIFAFGGGNTVNRYLLDLLAYRNKGDAQVVGNQDQIPRELPQFFARMRDPLLIGLQADFGRINADEVYPQILSDFYRELPVVVYGRFNPKQDREFVMRLTGMAGTRRKEIVFRKNLDEAGKGDREIARNWAFQKSYAIIGEISRVGESPHLLQQLGGLSAEFGIRTSYNE